MKYAERNRGSALMLTVGLLTIIAMLGSTFLISSYLDAQQAEVMVLRAPISPLVNGVFSQIQQILKFDAYLAKGFGAYGQLTATPADWRKFLDMPSGDVDQWLAEISDAGDAWWSVVFANDIFYDLVDTDGDGEDDAKLYDARVMNANGDAYYMAVRVIDLSGLICIGRAGDREATFLPIDPARIDLKGFLGDETYAELSTARRGSGSSLLEQYTIDCGRRLLSPASGYSPFSVADEYVLRWRKSGSAGERSRLFEILADQGDKTARLTTFSSSLSVMRYPGWGDERARILIDSREALTSPASNEALRLCFLLKDAMGTPDGSDAAPTVIDNPRGGTGEWNLITDNPDAYGNDYLQNPADAEKGGEGWLDRKNVHYNIAPQEDGDHILSVLAPSEVNSASNVKVQLVYFSAGTLTEATLTWDQTQGGGQWVDLGVLPDLAAGVFVFVDIIAAGTEGFVVNADAVALTRVTGFGSPEAAHFAANAWAYLSMPGEENGEAYAVAPQATWIAYGVVPQMVISEVFLHLGTFDGEPQWGRAIELINPTEETIGPAAYRLTCGGGYLEFNVSASPGDRIVLWTTGPSGPAKPGQGDFDFGGDGTWLECGALDNFPDSAIRIERFSTIQGAMDVWIPVDSIVPGEVESDMGTYLAERDDDIDRQRCLIPKYVKSSVSQTGHTLGAPNMLDEAELAQLEDVMEGFYIRRLPTDKLRPDSVGDFSECYLVGPDSDGGDLPHKLYPVDDATGQLDTDRRAYYNKLSRGRGNIGFTNPDAKEYPDVPWGTLLAEFIETLDPDPRDGMDPHVRIYGRININPAPKDVLARLPFPVMITWEDSDNNTYEAEVDVDMAAQYIIDYRDSGGSFGDLVDRSYNEDGSDGGPTILRADPDSAMKGFFTPGEIAIPLAAYAENLMEITMAAATPAATLDRMDAGYLDGRDSLYRAVISSVTVNSDTFAITAVVNVGNPPRQSTTYLAVIDRSNCEDPKDSPSLLFLSEIK